MESDLLKAGLFRFQRYVSLLYKNYKTTNAQKTWDIPDILKKLDQQL